MRRWVAALALVLGVLAAPLVHAHGTVTAPPECPIPSGSGSWGATPPLWASDPAGFCKTVWSNYTTGVPWFGNKDGGTCNWAIHCSGGGGENEYGYWDRPAFKIAPVAVNPCVAGALTTANATVGWSRTSSVNEVDHVGAITFPSGTICDGTCQAEVTDNGKVGYKSQTPAANGLYRLSVDFTVRRTAVQCTTPTNDPFSKTATPPPCPGQVGEFNGKTVCVGTAAAPVPSPVGLNVPRQTGQAAEVPGNPAAGLKPTSGEGSLDGAGRTPVAGNGGPGGGPALAAGAPSTATGTVGAPAAGEEQAACGAPGQPKCGIDESGTPSGQNALSQAEGLLGQLNTDAGTKIDEYKQLQNPAWTWTFALPTGCTPYDFGEVFGGLTINPCNWQTEIHAIMAILWIMAAVFTCTRMVFATLGGK